MTFVIKPYPEFGWSISRQRKLDRCPRAYFYHYYLGWNGWLDDAPRERRLAYRLSKLTSLDALLGQEVDARARELEAAARAGSALPAAEELEAHTRTSLRQIWARAKKGRPAFEARPKQVTMLRSLYLRHDTRPETERLDEKVGPSMRGLLATSHWERLRGRGAEGVVEVPDFAHFFWAGVKVYAAPDLAYVHDDVLHVVDWKSGREEATDPTQVLLQMWWALETYPALARAAAAGGLEVRGRGADTVKVLGELVWLPRVEAEAARWLAQEPMLRGMRVDLAVAAVPHPRLGHELVLAVSPAAGGSELPSTDLLLASLRRFQAAALPVERVRRLEVVETIPRTALGKCRRELLASRLSRPAATRDVP